MPATFRLRWSVMASVTALMAGCAGSAPGTAVSAPSASSSAVSPGTGGSSTGASAVTPAVDAATAARYQAVLDDVRAHGGFPGVIAGVLSPEGDWVGSSGTAGPGQDRVPTTADHTRIGSLTKTMTATILLQLVQEGRLSLDDRIGSWVPDVPNSHATLRQVADMTSGIPDYTAMAGFETAQQADPTRLWTADELIDFIRTAPADFAPGAGWSYSNTNYVLLGQVIGQVTAQPLAEVFDERLFRPLGMTATVYPSGAATLPEPHLSGITQENGATIGVVDWSPSEANTAGEVVSTFEDLRIWGRALFTGEGILEPHMQQLRRDSVIFGLPPLTAAAGYGIGIGDRNGWWGHDGSIAGFTSSLQHDEATDTTIIVLANSNVGFGNPTAYPAPAVLAGLQAASR